tara:strand:+ start:265 stop:1140 length:876 start_codon:yes stop_codon:yes gene_type:complete
MRILKPMARRLAHLRSGEEGQAMVEAAIVLPLMTFIVVGTIQLLQIQQAKVLTEYAAYQATRTGIVHNGDRKPMLNAALIAVLPSLGATDSLAGKRDPFRNRRRPGLLQTWLRAKVLLTLTGLAQCGVASLHAWLNGFGLPIPNFTPRAGLVNIEITNPTPGDLPERELDFDCVDGRCQGVAAADARRINRLSIRLRYNYWMRIPFAANLIHDAWLASVFGRKHENRLSPIHNEEEPQVEPPRNLTMQENIEFAILRFLADRGYHFIPLETTYAMQMQSNLYRHHLARACP